MGIFSKFKEYSESSRDRKIERNAKTVKNAKAIREDRWSAIAYFAEDLTVADKTIPYLLPRFEYSLEHGINDTREKELAMKGIVRFGQEAIPFLREHLAQTTRIAWPIKILKEVADEPTVVGTLKNALNFKDVTFDQGAVDKNYDILCYLRDYQVVDEVDKLKHFLNDPDERVRFACTELLVEQNSPAIPAILEPLLGDDSVENRRIKQSVLRAFLDKGWALREPAKFAASLTEYGIAVTPQGQLVMPNRVQH